jgi:protein-tyrosine phosphatase
MTLIRRILALTSTVAVSVAVLVATLGCNPPPSHLAAGGAGGSGAGEGGAAGSAACVGPDCSDAGPSSACPRSEPVLAGTVINARDLGGIPVSPAGSVACGAILRGPPLFALSESGCAAVAALGLKTVIDLRTESERAGRPDAPCVAARIVKTTLPIPYNVSPTDYRNDFNANASIATIFQTLADPANYPVYVHCTWGRDRTGVVAAAILLALGASRADVMQEYALSTESVGAYPDSLAAVIDEVDAMGGIEAALRAKGISDGELAALRARAVAP